MLEKWQTCVATVSRCVSQTLLVPEIPGFRAVTAQNVLLSTDRRSLLPVTNYS